MFKFHYCLCFGISISVSIQKLKSLSVVVKNSSLAASPSHKCIIRHPYHNIIRVSVLTASIKIDISLSFICTCWSILSVVKICNKLCLILLQLLEQHKNMIYFLKSCKNKINHYMRYPCVLMYDYNIKGV